MSLQAARVKRTIRPCCCSFVLLSSCSSAHAPITPKITIKSGTKIIIVSGGQTGADTAALRFALAHGFAHGGWCPRGRKRENGVIPSCFRLRETPSRGYAQRTLWNVRDSDGTVVFSLADRLAGGTRKTVHFARELGKPCLHLAAQRSGLNPAYELKRFLRRHRIGVLNVAGPRKSQELGIERFVTRTLKAALL